LADRTTPDLVTQTFTVLAAAAVAPSWMLWAAVSAPFAGPAALMTMAASATTMAGDGRRIDRFIVFSLSR
jgi:hypothetical protein